MFRSSALQIVALLLVGVSAGLAQAGVWLQTAVTASSESSDSGSGMPQSVDTRWIDSSTVAYAFPQGFILGAQLLYSRASLSGDNALAWGPKGGLLLKGFELSTAFLPIVSFNSGGSSFTGGGFSINVGYTFRAAGPLRVGLQCVYWAMTLTQQDGQSLLSHPHLSKFSPQLALGLDL